MEIITGENLAKLCDYSFGDHHVVWDKNLKGEFKVANYSNAEFLVKARDFEGDIMTLFIDNIRLYGRTLDFEGSHAQADAQFIGYLMVYNNLLELCIHFPKNKFVIFTSHEDTPIDETIAIPNNVLGVHAVNAVFNNDKIHPFPIGLQRQIGDDNRLEIIQKVLSENKRIEPSKLLYINCGIERNLERQPLSDFQYQTWVTARFDKDSKFFPYDKYEEFLTELRDHKFVACPKGHGFDTHRIWETLYMRRVPVMLNHPYFIRLMQGFPVLFVDDWKQITEQFLIEKQKLYQEALQMDLNKLDLNNIFAERMKLYGV